MGSNKVVFLALFMQKKHVRSSWSRNYLWASGFEQTLFLLFGLKIEADANFLMEGVAEMGGRLEVEMIFVGPYRSVGQVTGDGSNLFSVIFAIGLETIPISVV